MVHFRNFLIATQFLTRLPIPARLQTNWSMEDLRDSVHIFPLVGLLVGLLGSLVYAVAVFINLPPVLAAILTVAAQVLVTGALHEDGLADVCDGFGGGRTREQKLEIMRDSRIGTYGTIGLILTLALRIAAISTIAHPEAVAAGLIAAAALSRASMPVAMLLLPQARAEGLAASAGRPRRGLVGLGVGLGVATSFLCLPVIVAVVAITASVVATGLLLSFVLKQIGGITGDTLGFSNNILEILIISLIISIN